jgi:hypothetical protein
MRGWDILLYRELVKKIEVLEKKKLGDNTLAVGRGMRVKWLRD